MAETEENKQEKKIEDKKTEVKTENVKEQKIEKQEASKSEEKKETKKTEDLKKEQKKVKKTEAIVRGLDMPISKKNSMQICKFIKGRKIDEAILIVQNVEKKKVAVPFNGYEIPHRKGKGMMSGRYPIKTSSYFVKLLKLLRANAIVNGLDLERARIYGKANDAARPFKRSGSERFKRTNIDLKLIEK